MAQVARKCTQIPHVLTPLLGCVYLNLDSHCPLIKALWISCDVFSQGTGVVAGVLVIEVPAAASRSASCAVDHSWSCYSYPLAPHLERYVVIIIIIIILLLLIMMSISWTLRSLLTDIRLVELEVTSLRYKLSALMGKLSWWSKSFYWERWPGKLFD